MLNYACTLHSDELIQIYRIYAIKKIKIFYIIFKLFQLNFKLKLEANGGSKIDDRYAMFSSTYIYVCTLCTSGLTTQLWNGNNDPEIKTQNT